MTPGAGRHRAADDPDELAEPEVDSAPLPPFMAAAFQRESGSPFEYAPPALPPLAPLPPLPPVAAAAEPQFIPLRPPRRSHRSIGTAVAAVLALAVVLGGGYVFLTRSATDSGAGAAPPLTISLPDATTSPSPVAGSKAAVVHLPVKYRSVKGHFVARFAHQPTIENQPVTEVGHQLVAYRAFDPASKAVVQGSNLPDVPASEYGAVLDNSVAGFRASAGSLKITARVATFRHHPARRLTLTTTNGDLFTVLITIYPGTRVYLLNAPAGAQFDALAKSFATLP